MSAGKKRARAISSDEAMPQIKMPRLENGDGRHNKNRAELSFSTSGISGNATVQNAGGHIINGDYTVHRTLSTDDNPKIKQKSEVMKWIYTVDSDTSLSYNAAQKVHLSGTGSWFLDGSQFVQWKEQPGSLLWLYGGPGCGKTVLSYAAIANVIGICGLKPLARGYAYYFFDARNDKLQLLAHEMFLRSLITQLSDRCGEELPSALVSLYRACDDGRRAPSLISLEETLLQILECFEDAYIVIDALDECAENSKSDLLHWKESVTSKASGKIHLMASSRPEQQVMQGLASLEASCLQQVVFIESATIGDISAFMDAEVAKMAKWKNVERQKIKAIILPRSGGMFRWVELQLYAVSKCSNKKDLYEQLVSLPKGLDETYARIFKRSQNPDVLLKLLQWLAFSQRELTVKEIAEVAAVDLSRAEGPVYDPDMRYEDPAEVLNLCYGLVTEFEGIIKLAHFSVKEYLIKHIQPAPGRTSAQISHSVIAQTCLAHLLHFDKPSMVRWSKNIRNSRNRIHSLFPLSDYAAVYWVSHFHSSSADAIDSPRLLKMLRGLFTLPQSYAMTTWVLLHPPRGYWSMMSLDDIASALHYACAAGLTEVVMHLIEAGADINEAGKGPLSGTPLLVAINNGHPQLAELLLEKGADANITQKNSCTALASAIKAGHIELAELLLDKVADVKGSLRAASAGGHLEIAKLLLQNGANVDVEYRAALQAASGKGHLDIVQLLLDKGADIDADGGKSLLEASTWGHLEITKLLLEHGADINLACGVQEYSTALQAASRERNLEIVKLLLENGADVNIEGGVFGTALRAAAYAGDLEIAKLLLEYGADVNVEGGCDGTALEDALTSEEGNLEVVKLLLENGADANVNGGILWNDTAYRHGELEVATLLLEHGADANTTSGNHGTALQQASKRGRLEICKLLLNNGANVNIEGGEFGTALWAASAGGHLEITKLLLEHGADVDAEKGEFLQVACAGGHLELVEVLLGKRADANIMEAIMEAICGDTALGAASAGSHWEIVRLLQEKSANTNASIVVRFGGRALQLASKGGHLEIIKLLLEHGAAVNVEGGRHSAALWAASAGGHLEIAKLLLEHGSDVNIEGEKHGTALRAASARGNLDITKLLLEHGGNVNIEGGKFGSALHAASAGGHLEIIKLLLETGIDVNLKSGHQTALQVATVMGHVETVQLLQEWVRNELPGRVIPGA